MMKPSTDDKATGKLHEVKGTIKETIGKVTNDPETRSGWQCRKECRQGSELDRQS